MTYIDTRILVATRANINRRAARIPTFRRQALHIALTRTRRTGYPFQLPAEILPASGSHSVCPISSSVAIAEEIIGQSGRTYKVGRMLQDKGFQWGRVYLATEGTAQVVLKEIPQDWSARNEIYGLAADCSHIRIPVDSIPERRMLVFEYINEHLLNLVQKDISLAQIKRILKNTLEGIASLHERGISHNDIKPNNILVQTEKSPNCADEVERVLITDLEDAVHLEPGRGLRGAPLGNHMWRSPEAHAEGPMEMPSDIFAFGIVCIYAMTKNVIFAVSNPDLADDEKVGTVLFRQMSYFADEGAFQDLLQYLGEDNPMSEVLEAIEEACQDVPREPFAAWQLPGLDNDFKDLVLGFTKLDPRKRITAREGLAHRWFRDV